MTSFPRLIDTISQRLESFSAAQGAATTGLGDEAEGFVAQAAAALAGGKRLRGRFCATGWRAVSGGREVPASVVDACASLEVFQAAALVHDDLIDNSDTRRGRPSAHRALEAWHIDAGWTGDAAAFGRAGSVLLGDLLLSWSADLFDAALALLDAPTARARAEYGRMRREVMVGQFLDVAEESAWPRTPAHEHAGRALRIASLKSARYSVQQPLVIGGSLADGDEDQLASLADIGHPLGLAFQLRDDVLGVFGDERETGKPAGDDLREGKRTLLIAYAREAAGTSAREEIDALLGDRLLDDDEIDALRDTIVATGALSRVEDLITAYADEAGLALSSARFDADAASELQALVEAATRRRS
ncbi:polyprenyl synthetase family protein [Microbacterium betulae]|uniref:Polyprenyl synthetase family protein n=1 Tax=Microbacterium betulae TaxID=2981139 RepID=A0AA97FF33_9MICO|nr:polyprenyl synthetase family protein [Microbacterium sp. AB]WOF21850.1 polyprenyl synthetase family protein [Microbacterium sp. AB]